jgi:hypothetical protein
MTSAKRDSADELESAAKPDFMQALLGSVLNTSTDVIIAIDADKSPVIWIDACAIHTKMTRMVRRQYAQ